MDDEEVIRSVVSDAFEEEGYEVRCANDGRAALEILRSWRPSAIVLDLMMPVMDGWQFAEACADVPECTGVPIIVMSAAHNLRETAGRLHAHGVRAVLAKPFELDALLGIVERLTASPHSSGVLLGK